MNNPQVLDHTDDIDQRVSALESDVDAIKTNYEGLTGTLQKSFARVADDIQDIRALIAKVIAHSNERFNSMDDKIQSTQVTLTGQIQSLNDKMDDRMQSLDDKIQSTQVTLTGQIQSLNDKMETGCLDRMQSLDDRMQSLDDKIQSTQVTLTGQIQSLNDKMDDRMQSLDDRMQSLDDRIYSTRNDLEKSFRDDLRDFRREIKEDVRDSFNGFRWTMGIIVALAVAVMKLLP